MTPEQSQDAELWRQTFAMRMDAFERNLEENTEATQRVEDSTRELVSIITSWKGAMNVFEFVGKIAKPLTAIVAFCGAVYAWWQHK